MRKHYYKKSKNTHKFGFTITELLVVVSVMAVLAIISGVIYANLQKRTAGVVAMDTLKKVTNEVLVKRAAQNRLPASIDGMFDLPADVSISYTDTSSEGGLPRYSGLSDPQNGKLFYDICVQQVSDGLGNGPNDFGGGTVAYVSGCYVYNVQYSHINGWNGGFRIDAPNVTESTLQGYVDHAGSSHPAHPSYEATLRNFMDRLIARFKSQGGTFPVSFWNNWQPTPVLPSPSSVSVASPNFCITAASLKYPDLTYISSLKDPVPKPGTGCE